MPRWVLLKHTTPDGAWHLDWMLEPRAVGEQDGHGVMLLTFRIGRLAARDWVSPEAARRTLADVSKGGFGFAARRLPDHRSQYLDYEGPISGNRGEVRRLLAGTCTWWNLALGEGRAEVMLDTPWGAVRARGERRGRRAWRFEAREGVDWLAKVRPAR